MFKTEKHEQATKALNHIRWMLRDLRPELDLEITYTTLDEEDMQEYSAWYIQRFGLLAGEEYVMIRKNESGSWNLLYTINVTGTAVLAIAAETMDLISRKF